MKYFYYFFLQTLTSLLVSTNSSIRILLDLYQSTNHHILDFIGTNNPTTILWAQSNTTNLCLQYNHATYTINPHIKQTLNIHTIKATIILIELTPLDDLNRAFASLKETKFWSDNARFLIISNGINMKNIFEVAWRYSLIDTWVYNAEFYTYDPIGGGCGNKSFFASTNFSRRNYGDFNGCPLKVLTTENPPYIGDLFNESDGLEIEVVKAVAVMLKMRLVVLMNASHTTGARLDDGSYNGLVGLMQAGLGDVVVCSLTFISTYYDSFDATVSYSDIGLITLAPNANPLPVWMNIGLIYHWGVWGCIGVTVLVTSGVGWVTGWFGLFEMWQSAFQSLPNSPKCRVMFIAWVLFCFLLLNMFQSVLLSFIFKPVYEVPIDNYEIAFERGLRITGNQFIASVLAGSDNPFYKYLRARWYTCGRFTNCMPLVTMKRDFVYIVSNRYIAGNLRKYPEHRGKFLVFPKKDTHLLTMFVSKGYYALSKINLALLRLKQSGLIEKWDTYGNAKLIYSGGDGVKDNEKLNIDHLLIPFILLVLGLTTATIAFLIEIHYERN